MDKPTVFISYSHLDEAWKEKFLPHFLQLERAGHLTVWDDRQIRMGENWYLRIWDVLQRTRFAVCLISAHYLQSSFCMEEEIPFLLQQQHKGAGKAGFAFFACR
jgi:hypothetical protein